MDIYKSNLFRFVKGDMLVGKPAVMTIKSVEVTELPAPKTGEMEQKYLLTFEESKKPLILNATNAGNLAKLFGRDTDAWAGRVVELYAEEVKAFGKVYQGARIREAKQAKQARKSQQQAAESTSAQRRARQAENTALLRGNGDDTPIGEEPTIQPVDLYAPPPVEESAPAEELDF